MIIQSAIVKNTLNISVTGSGTIPFNVDYWRQITQIRDDSITNIHLTFFDTLMVQAEVVEEIIKLKNNYPLKNFKIYTLRRNLSTYLNKLGIKNNYLPEKSLKKSKRKNCRAIGIGGSAESLRKIFTLVDNLPLAEISVFIVQHVQEETENLLGKLLEKRTDYQVRVPRKTELIQNRTIYVAPEGLHLLVDKGHVYLEKSKPVEFARPSINVLFRSLSKFYRDEVILIILSGYGSDGAESLKYARENDSTIIIEDPAGIQDAGALPSACIQTGFFDYKFPIEEIVSYLSRNIKQRQIEDKKLSHFLEAIKEKYGYDYTDYEKESIKRRINLVMINEGFDSFGELAKDIIRSSEQFKNLFMGFSVPVTEFFRNPALFSHLRENILPNLKSYPHLNIWCAGCASGEEVYSLAILLYEMGLYDRSRIYATDINPYVLQEAQNGLFALKNSALFARNYSQSGGVNTLSDYFEEKNDYLKIKDFLKEKILFFEHSLVRSGVLNEFQLIFCRNVLIYFNQELQNRVLKLFSDSLDLCGYLVLGDKEDLLLNKGNMFFVPADKKNRIYTKR